jgi:hypothetical protein
VSIPVTDESLIAYSEEHRTREARLDRVAPTLCPTDWKPPSLSADGSYAKEGTSEDASS